MISRLKTAPAASKIQSQPTAAPEYAPTARQPHDQFNNIATTLSQLILHQTNHSTTKYNTKAIVTATAKYHTSCFVEKPGTCRRTLRMHSNSSGKRTNQRMNTRTHASTQSAGEHVIQRGVGRHSNAHANREQSIVVDAVDYVNVHRCIDRSIVVSLSLS